MKNLHIPTILVTLGLVGLVAILSGQNMVGSPRVTVHNPLGVPGWVPSGVWMARNGYDPSTGTNTYQDYTVPAGHFALARSITGQYAAYVQADDGSGSGFITIAGVSGKELTSGSSSASLEPGIFFDEGTVIRASSALSTVHGYLIPK